LTQPAARRKCGACFKLKVITFIKSSNFAAAWEFDVMTEFLVQKIFYSHLTWQISSKLKFVVEKLGVILYTSMYGNFSYSLVSFSHNLITVTVSGWVIWPPGTE
jgi:hypothetical protein